MQNKMATRLIGESPFWLCGPKYFLLYRNRSLHLRAEFLVKVRVNAGRWEGEGERLPRREYYRIEHVGTASRCAAHYRVRDGVHIPPRYGCPARDT